MPVESQILLGSDGRPMIDPTKNVLDLVEAATQRSDDLRNEVTRRLEQKIDTEAKHVRELLALTTDYEEKLSSAEAKRIDAIRAVDVGAVAVAAERQAQSASVLAAQVAASAETLRTLVSTSAAALATQQSAIINPITEQIALLQKAQYEGAGKSFIADPASAQLAAEVRALTQLMAQGSGAKQQSIDASKILFGVIAAITTFAALAVGIISLATR